MPILNFKTDKMFTDISDEVQNLVPENFEGLVNVYSPHTTCCVFQTENELLHLVDVRFFLDKQVPYVKQPEGEHRNVKYLHDMISLRADVPVDEQINGHSHIRSLFFNPELTLKKGIYTKVKPNNVDKADINKAITILNKLNKYNFSQGTVVRDKKVIAIEGRGGTQKLLTKLKNKQFKNNGVLVKFPKKKTRFKSWFANCRFENI